jgi:hypothetical protein
MAGGSAVIREVPRPASCLGGGPISLVKVPDARWQAAKAKAASKGETITDVINRKLEEYLAED